MDAVLRPAVRLLLVLMACASFALGMPSRDGGTPRVADGPSRIAATGDAGANCAEAPRRASAPQAPPAALPAGTPDCRTAPARSRTRAPELPVRPAWTPAIRRTGPRGPPL